MLRPEERVALGHDLQELIPNKEVLEGPPPPIQEDIVLKIHAEIAKRLKGLLADPPEPWKLPARDGLLWRVGSDEPFRFMGEGPEIDGILWGVINLLLEAGTHLQACPVCSEPFVARKRQAYCSTACAQRERDERKKKKKQS